MAEMTQEQQIKEKILDLQQQLLDAHPKMPTLLRTIHDTLLKDPVLVQTITEEEIGIITQGLMKQTQISISTTAKKPALTKKRVSQMSVDEL